MSSTSVELKKKYQESVIPGIIILANRQLVVPEVITVT
jgi:hypothetical protein